MGNAVVFLYLEKKNRGKRVLGFIRIGRCFIWLEGRLEEYIGIESWRGWSDVFKILVFNGWLRG